MALDMAVSETIATEDIDVGKQKKIYYILNMLIYFSFRFFFFISWFFVSVFYVYVMTKWNQYWAKHTMLVKKIYLRV
jgi:hypothetical protein